jgi:hypothetical protein
MNINVLDLGVEFILNFGGNAYRLLVVAEDSR